MTNEQKLELALNTLKNAALAYANIIDEMEYNPQSAPTFLQDADDFAYDIQTFVEDEIENLKEKQ